MTILAARDKISLLLNWPHKLMSSSDLLRSVDFLHNFENRCFPSLHSEHGSAAAGRQQKRNYVLTQYHQVQLLLPYTDPVHSFITSYLSMNEQLYDQ